MPKKVLQFKIYLKGIEPPIWRQVQISEDSTFWNLNTAIQDSMGWQEGASHFFVVQESAAADMESCALRRLRGLQARGRRRIPVACEAYA